MQIKTSDRQISKTQAYEPISENCIKADSRPEVVTETHCIGSLPFGYSVNVVGNNMSVVLRVDTRRLAEQESMQKINAILGNKKRS